jgi:16S rRNA (cytosine967-C5)-methyltransferase
LATDLVYGTLAWQGRLDHHLGGLLRGTTVARLEPPVRVALRLGLYQLLFLDRVPAYAAVDASVRLARRAGPGAAGLVNAVLRRVGLEGRAALALPDAAADPVARLAVEWSHPRWLVERLAEQVGRDALPALLAAHNRPGRVALRAHPGRVARDALAAELAASGVAVGPGRFAPDALVVERAAGRLRALPAFRAGRFAYQGEASQLVTLLLGLRPGARVLDACAAPGGKALQAAASAGAGGRVVALDVQPAGARRIVESAARLGLDTVDVAVADARRPPLRGPFDAVLADAPCSGLGTLRRHPELRWRRAPEDLPRLAALQRELLDGVAPLVAAGGVLVYAVCTPLGAETDDVVADFLASNRDFALEPAAPFLPAAARHLVTAGGALRTWPHRDDLDAFFAVRLRRA